MKTFDPHAPEPLSHRRRWLPWLGGGLVVGLIVLGLWPKAIEVEGAVVSRGELQVTVNEEGRTRVINRYVVVSPVSGQLQRIELKPGAEVVAGETVLARLESGGADLLDVRSQAQAEARVKAAESREEEAEVRLGLVRSNAALARREGERAKTLGEEGVISPQELDVAETREVMAVQEERAAEFALRVARHEAELARAALLRGTGEGEVGPVVEVKSPVSGRVLRVWQESARPVLAGHGLVEVGDPTDLEVVVEVLSRDAVALVPGARVILEQWGGEKALEGRVRLAEPAAFTKVSALGVEEQRVNLVADLVSSPEERQALGDGFRVEARIVAWEGQDVLQVPAGALFQLDGGWRIFVVEGGRARFREVMPGRSDGRLTAVEAGLREGEKVVVYPGDRMADGVRVKIGGVGASR